MSTTIVGIRKWVCPVLQGSERFHLVAGRHEIWAHTCAGAGAGDEPKAKADVEGAEPKAEVDVAGACSQPT